MRVGVISDTHLHRGDGSLIRPFAREVSGVDLILHAGDLVDLEVLDELEAIAPVMAVSGNMDGRKVRERLPDRRTLDLEGVRVGLIHGWGPPWDLSQRVLGEFPPEVTVVVFGHSHLPHCEWVGERLLFNPGSLFADSFSKSRSYGLLTIEGHQIEAEIYMW